MSESSTSPIMFNVAYESDYESYTCSDDSDNGDDFEQTPDVGEVVGDDDDGFEDKEDDDQFDIREWIAGVEAEDEDEVIEEGEWKMGLSVSSLYCLYFPFLTLYFYILVPTLFLFFVLLFGCCCFLHNVLYHVVLLLGIFLHVNCSP